MTEIPLSERVDAPETVDRPANTSAVTWRSLTLDDVDAVHDLEREIGASDHPHYTVPREEIVDDLGRSFMNLALDTMGAFDPEGTLLAHGLAFNPPGDTIERSLLLGGVRPSARGRGIGRALLQWQVDRGMQQLAASRTTLPGWLQQHVDESVTSARRLYERFGFTVARYFLELRRDSSEPVPEVALDPSVRAENYSPDRSDATLAARNNSFRDHWGSQLTPQEGWDVFTGRSVMRPDLSSIAIGERDGVEEVAGFVLVSANEEDWPGQGFSSGYIDLVGVGREWRGRGIAPALLARSLRLIAEAGLDKAVLDVDAENPTGALGLYTGLGFTEAHRSIAYTRVF